jgi:hypothetical protein
MKTLGIILLGLVLLAFILACIVFEFWVRFLVIRWLLHH